MPRRALAALGLRDDPGRQAGALVADLDPHRVPGQPRRQLDAPAAVLQRVDDEVADGLREPQAIAEHVDAGQVGSDDEARTERSCHEVPYRELFPEQVGDGDGLLAPHDAAAAARGPEVLEREPGATQLEVERRNPRRWRLVVQRREGEPCRTQGPAELVAGSRDPHRGPRLPGSEDEQGDDPGDRQDPSGGVQHAHAASSTTGTTGSSRR